LFRKVLIIIVVELLDLDVDAQALLVLLILLISFYLQLIYHPFTSSTLNDLEKQGLCLNSMTLFLGLINHIGNDQTFQNVFTIFFVFCYIFFYVYWIYNIWIKGKFKCFKRFLSLESMHLVVKISIKNI